MQCSATACCTWTALPKLGTRLATAAGLGTVRGLDSRVVQLGGVGRSALSLLCSAWPSPASPSPPCWTFSCRPAATGPAGCCWQAVQYSTRQHRPQYTSETAFICKLNDSACFHGRQFHAVHITDCLPAVALPVGAAVPPHPGLLGGRVRGKRVPPPPPRLLCWVLNQV